MMHLKKFIVLLVVTIMIFSIPGCSKNNDLSGNEKLNIYVLENDEIIPIIKNFNMKNKDEIIITTEFENTNTLFTKLQSEIMAGKGPDLIYYNYYTNNQNMMSYINNDVFVDLNDFINSDLDESKLDLNNYNKVAMNAGLINDKQVFMPLTYLTDVIVTSKENCDRYNFDFSAGLSFDNIDKKLSEFLIQQNGNGDICTSLPYTLFFDKLIEEEIYSNGKESNFHSLDFKNKFSSIEKSYVVSDFGDNNNVLQEMANGNLLFLGGGCLSGNPFVSIIEADEMLELSITPEIISYYNQNKVGSYVGSFLAINNNSNNKQLAYEFIKFALNDEQQMKIETNDIPINITAYETYIRKAKDYIENDTDNNEKLLTFLQEYEEIIANVNRCEVKNYYYYENISYPVLNDYLDQKIDYDTFINHLLEKTKIYFEE